MIKCKKCHFKNPDDTIYCTECGNQVTKSAETTSKKDIYIKYITIILIIILLFFASLYIFRSMQLNNALLQSNTQGVITDDEVLVSPISEVDDTDVTPGDTPDTSVEPEEEYQETILNKKEIIKHQDGNIYLYEDNKQIDFLTTRAKICSNVSETCNSVSYDIIHGKGEFGVVEKNEIIGNCAETSYYGINLNTSADLLTLLYTNSNCLLNNEAKIDTFNLVLTLTNPENIIDTENISKEGFNLSGNSWEKIINLKDLLK